MDELIPNVLGKDVGIVVLRRPKAIWWEDATSHSSTIIVVLVPVDGVDKRVDWFAVFIGIVAARTFTRRPPIVGSRKIIASFVDLCVGII
jgi:hypothetical protein